MKKIYAAAALSATTVAAPALAQGAFVEFRALTPELARDDALARVEAVGEDVLAEENRIVPLAEAATLDQTSAGILAVFGFAIAVVFLVLSAQFESFVSAVVGMATVPPRRACAGFALLFNGDRLHL